MFFVYHITSSTIFNYFFIINISKFATKIAPSFYSSNMWIDKAALLLFIRKGVKNMNEWAHLRRQAEYYKEAYPPGTRIMRLSMGTDPHPVEDNTRGTVKAVDDIGTLYCSFDNGRSLGLVPREDSFRKLTAEELAEEQENSMDEVESGPVMEM